VHKYRTTGRPGDWISFGGV